MTEPLYVVTTTPGPHVEFVELETADGQLADVTVPYERYKTDLWRLGPLYPAAEVERMRARVESVREEAQGNWDGLCLAQEVNERLRAENEQLRRVIGALKSIISESDPCIHQQIVEARAAIERGDYLTLEQLEARLSAVERPQTAPPATPQLEPSSAPPDAEGAR